MAKKIFSWENFPYSFLKAVVYGKETSKELQPTRHLTESDFLIPYMNRICTVPDDSFVRKYRRAIEDYFLAGSNHLLQVVKELERLHYADVVVGENEDMLFTLRQKTMTQTLLNAYMIELRKTGKTVCDSQESMFQVPKTIDLTMAETSKIPLYSYQEHAVGAMYDYFLKDGQQSAILAMPTASGKTRTSVYYFVAVLIQNVLFFLLRAPLAALVKRAHGQQDMGVGIAAARIVYGKIGAHSRCDKLWTVDVNISAKRSVSAGMSVC